MTHDQPHWKGVNVTFAENPIKLFLCPRRFRRGLERNNCYAGGAAAAVVLLTVISTVVCAR